MKKILGTFLVAALGGFIALAAFILFSDENKAQKVEYAQVQPSARFVNLPASMNAEALDFTTAAEKSLNTVVHVKTKSEVQPVNNPWSQFFGYDLEPQVRMGSGSGVIISNDGYIVTNNHVVEGADIVEVSLNNGETYDAEMIGTDPSTDLAVLKIDTGHNLPSIGFANSDNVKVGEWVLAVGNPFDLTSTVTAGIVSAKARNINLLQFDPNNEVFPVESFIQTDAAVNPGNSGGALVNTNGDLIGINTAIASRTGSYAGYSFAIPSGIVEKVTRDLVEFGNVQRAYIGVKINDVNQELAGEIGLDKIGGVYVNGLSENGAAEEAGVRSGDVIIGVNNIQVNSVPELQEQVSKYRPGDKINVHVWRDGNERTIPVTLRNLRGNTELRAKEEISTARLLGAELSIPTEETLKSLGLSNGVQVNRIGKGKLYSSGVRSGFIITDIDQQKVTKLEDIEKVLRSKAGGVLIEGYYPDGTKAYYGFGV